MTKRKLRNSLRMMEFVDSLNGILSILVVIAGSIAKIETSMNKKDRIKELREVLAEEQEELNEKIKELDEYEH